MEAVVKIVAAMLFIKLFLFWLWLWQLKEYHLRRFLAHFETQAFAKIISSTWRFKYPKFTKKIIAISLSGVFFGGFLIWNGLFLPAFLLIIILPLIFQFFTFLWRKNYLRKAIKKRESYKNLLVIGITGSYGKTSTKEFLYTILASKWGNKVLKTREHQNSEMGIARCILNELQPEHEIFIVEMGAYNRGGIKLLCKIAKPKIGILTGINEQHMSTFGSQENIIKTKYELIESLPQGRLPDGSQGVAFFNGKNKYCRELYQKTAVKKYLYGENAELGMENLEGVKLTAKELGMSEGEINLAVNKIENKFPGIKIKDGAGGLKIIDATYSANPESVITHLEYIKNFPGKKILIMPCLIELGSSSKEVHRRIGAKIAQVCDLAIITTKDRFAEINEGAAAIDVLPSQKCEILLIENPKEIFSKLKSTANAGDVVLLESRVPKESINLLISGN